MPIPAPPSPPLLIGPEALEMLEKHALEAYPSEACGLLVGEPSARGWTLRGLRRANNLASSRDRFLLDPGDHVRIDKEARAAGLSVLGTWHTHPNQPAIPSDADRRGAWESGCTVIVEVRAQALGELRAWRLADGRFVEQPVAFETRAEITPLSK